MRPERKDLRWWMQYLGLGTCFLWKSDLTSNLKCVATPLDQAANFLAMKFYSMPSWHRILDGGAPAPPPVVDLDRFSSVYAYQLLASHWEIRPGPYFTK